MKRFLIYIGRMVRGENIFQHVRDSRVVRKARKQEKQIQQSNLPPDPSVVIDRLIVRHSGEEMQCDFDLKNKSNQIVTITRIDLLEQRQLFSFVLRPNECKRLINAYIGPHRQKPTQVICMITFRAESGQYYQCREGVMIDPRDGAYDYSRILFRYPSRTMQ